MLDPAVLPGYLLAVLLVTIPPGPDNAYIVAVAVDRGSRAGVLSAVGMSLGMIVHATAAALGLALVLQSTPTALTVIRVGGAAYLAWLAFTTLRNARRAVSIGDAVPPDRQILGRAVLTNLTNPKIILFFAAFLPQFARPGYAPVALQFLTLGLMFLLVGLLWDSLVGLFAARLGTVLKSNGRAGTSVTVAAGLTFATLSVLLLLQALSVR